MRPTLHCKTIVLNARDLVSLTGKNPIVTSQIEHLIEQRENELASNRSDITTLGLSVFQCENRST